MYTFFIVISLLVSVFEKNIPGHGNYVNQQKVQIGMTEKQMLELMGNQYLDIRCIEFDLENCREIEYTYENVFLAPANIKFITKNGFIVYKNSEVD